MINFSIKRTIVFFRQYFSLRQDKIDEIEIIQSIQKGVEFKGTNLWVLVFAILLASIGLNVNSTAVIIGAMLISPLMGPIMGIGLGVGVYNFDLIKKAGRNLLVAVAISIATSSIYFLLTPLTEAQSELLARTTPTIWDVFIALFGGLAGIVAGASKEKGNVLPGVAIATALMPPLCTAGYGIANSNWAFFLGAIYLFFINSVFICLATFLIVRFLRFHTGKFVDHAIEQKIKRYIYIIILFTVVPSIFMAYRIVSHSIFEQNARKFIINELTFEDSQIVSKNINYQHNNNYIEISFIGNPVDSILLVNARKKLDKYNLTDTKLIIHQGNYSDRNDITSIKSGIIEDLYRKNEQLIKTKDDKIALLENELSKIKKTSLPTNDITKEIIALDHNIEEFSLGNSVLFSTKNNKLDTVYLVYIRFSNIPPFQEIERLQNWLKIRIKANNIKLVLK